MGGARAARPARSLLPATFHAGGQRANRAGRSRRSAGWTPCATRVAPAGSGSRGPRDERTCHGVKRYGVLPLPSAAARCGARRRRPHRDHIVGHRRMPFTPIGVYAPPRTRRSRWRDGAGLGADDTAVNHVGPAWWHEQRPSPDSPRTRASRGPASVPTGAGRRAGGDRRGGRLHRHLEVHAGAYVRVTGPRVGSTVRETLVSARGHPARRTRLAGAGADR